MPPKKDSRKQQSYYGFIEILNGGLKVTYVNVKTEKAVPELSFYVNEKYPSIKEFEDIPKIFGKNFKTLTLKVFQFETSEYLNNYEFCQALKLKLDSIKIPYYFISANDYTLTSLFTVTNITVKILDTVICVFTQNDKYCIGEYQFTKNGYKYICSRDVYANQEPEIIRNGILGTEKPAKIVATSLIQDEKNYKLLKNLTTIMQKFDNLVFGDCGSHEIWIEVIVEISKWILDNKNIKYYILPKCCREYKIVGKYSSDKIIPFTLAKIFCEIPFETIGHIPRRNGAYALAYTVYDFPNPIYLEPIPFNKKCHYLQIVLKMDINHFYTCQIQPIINEHIQNLPTTLNEMDKFKIPVIGFYDNLSVICVCKNGEYKFIDQWNGLEGKELMISFAEEEPKFCENAINDSKAKPSFVVFDLIQIMCMPIDKIEPEPHWCFSFTKDSENPILIEFDNFDGKKSAASPAFLMAMLLKEHLKAIKNETGKKAKEIAFCFFNKWGDDQKSRIKDGLKDACKLLKVECHFIRNEL